MLADEVVNRLELPRCSRMMRPLLEIDGQFALCRLTPGQSKSILDYQLLAEKFAFEKGPAQIAHYLKQISGGSLTDTLVLESAKLPASPAWIEIPVEFDNGKRGKVGYAVEWSDEKEDRIVMVVIVQTENRAPLVLGAMSMQMPVVIGDTYFRIHSWHDHLGDPGTQPDQRIQDDCQHYVLDFLEACFLLQMPKLTETKHVKHDERLQRSRVKKGKPPFLEYRRVRMLIDVPSVRYVREGVSRVASNVTERELGGGGHRKYHRVLPHARTYKDPDGKVRDVVPIPQHWRGDPKLGIIIHQKTIGQRGGE